MAYFVYFFYEVASKHWALKRPNITKKGHEISFEKHLRLQSKIQIEIVRSVDTFLVTFYHGRLGRTQCCLVEQPILRGKRHFEMQKRTV